MNDINVAIGPFRPVELRRRRVDACLFLEVGRTDLSSSRKHGRIRGRQEAARNRTYKLWKLEQGNLYVVHSSIRVRRSFLMHVTAVADKRVLWHGGWLLLLLLWWVETLGASSVVVATRGGHG
jgi:hypothetical protein